ncbi:MAG: aldo/keto reductase [Bacteroidales bacterium]|nr:aldo/keto reductase [Bacteroidales bacterium]
MKKISFFSIVSAVVLLAILTSCSGKSESNMTYRINQHTGDKVALLGFGCMRLPMMDDGNGNHIPDQDSINFLIDEAIRNGINYFDVAPSYMNGMNESSVGKALARHKRDKFFIATKLSTSETTLEAQKGMYEKSFKELQVDYIDYYLLHNVGRVDKDLFRARFIESGILEFLLEERQAGRIRNLGFSFHGDVSIYDTLFELGIQWDFVMIQMNYIDWQNATAPRNVNAEYLYNKALANNAQCVIMEPLFGGRLGNLGPVARRPLEAVNPNATPAEWAFRYVGSFDNVLTVLSGMNHIDHLRENVKTFSPLVPLNQEEHEALAVVTEIMTTAGFIDCTGCNYCVPCPFGVPIPDILLRYNEYISERKEIDKNDPVLQQAGTCKGDICKLCEKECPQRIGIVEQMKKIYKLVSE